jgi:hypothetical protein
MVCRKVVKTTEVVERVVRVGKLHLIGLKALRSLLGLQYLISLKFDLKTTEKVFLDANRKTLIT